MKNINIWYLYNSGFAVKIDQKMLIFDYYNDTPYGNLEGLDAGVISSKDLVGLEVYVFVSHAHHDHYNKVIYTWNNKNINSDITYIISDDVPKFNGKNIYYLKPNIDFDIKNIKIKTLKSNDEGIAFYIQVDNYYIFHSGDLNFWRWEGESKEWNESIEKIYKTEINKIKGFPMDIAFIPVDPRLEANYDLSLKYFIKNIMSKNCTIIPMHFGDQYNIFDNLKNDGYLEDNNILLISKRGQNFKR